MSSLWLNVLLIFVFLLLGSVFSGTELALVSLRGSQLDQMEQEDARGARVAHIARDPNTFLSTVQLGVTLSGFLSASFGESAISPMIVPVVVSWGIPQHIAAPVTTIVLTLIISYCSIVISEMVPKRIAMQRTEQIARAVVPAIDVFAKICKPIIWLIGKNTNGLVRLLGFDPNETESEVSDEELRVLVNTNTRLGKDERTILDDVFDASETIVAEVMRPRPEVAFIRADLSAEEASEVVAGGSYSRYPVTGENFDDILGFLHVRDLLRAPAGARVRDLMREILLLPSTNRLLPALSLMRREGVHIAVVVDEYGGTDGIVTLEDLVEELVGDIRDEYDDAQPAHASAVDGVMRVDARLTIEEFEEESGVELTDGDYETAAGFMLDQLGRLASVGDEIVVGDVTFRVAVVEGRRILALDVIPRIAGAEH